MQGGYPPMLGQPHSLLAEREGYNASILAASSITWHSVRQMLIQQIFDPIRVFEYLQTDPQGPKRMLSQVGHAQFHIVLLSGHYGSVFGKCGCPFGQCLHIAGIVGVVIGKFAEIDDFDAELFERLTEALRLAKPAEGDGFLALKVRR